jgi:endonuclease/exonuclease/phosphatase family metal-dependent hydrolase
MPSLAGMVRRLLGVAFAWVAALAARGDLTVMTWNLKGNGAPDWSTNAAQVQAIGRILQHLRPDVVAFQEVPWDFRSRMPAIVRAYLTNYSVVVSPGTDFVLTSAIASRHPIQATQSHLDNADLNPFGYNGRFTRDLFEAEIRVPGWPLPLHVFATHLKAGFTGTDPALRAAEASAISNHLARTFIPQSGGHPWLVCGDMNQDINPANAPAPNLRPIERLANAALGTRLLTPTNSVPAFREYTWSAIAGLSRRYDYVIPGSLLGSNYLSGTTFYSLTVGNTVPGITRSTSAEASDHLPVLVRFADPYRAPFSVRVAAAGADRLQFDWDFTPGGFVYRIERSNDLGRWDTLVPGLLTNRYQLPADGPSAWYRVVRTP